MSQEIPLSSSEIATLWMTYQQKTMIRRMLEYFITHAEDDQAKEIMQDTHMQVVNYIEDIKTILKNEGAAIPVGYTEKDVNVVVPKLYDNMFLRLLKEISMGLHTLHLTMSYRKDMISLYKELTAFTQSGYDKCVDYLQEKNVLPRPPAVSVPKTVKFAEGTDYMNGIHLFSSKRALNTVEVAHIYYAIETNVLGMQMITGFAQVVSDYSKILLESDIQTPATWGAKATESKVAPFSDKLMMYCVSLFCSFGLGSNALGTAFSLRGDLPLTLVSTAKDILTYGQDGGKIMAKNGWLEEPPSMEDRNDLIK